MTESRPEPDRRAQLASNLADLRRDIAAACAAANRPESQIRLVAVTKRFPASDVEHLAALGVRDIGESRDQEAAGKAEAVAESEEDVRWHFVGRLQRNKCKSVASYASMVHSVDRAGLVPALDAAALSVRDSPLEVLIQLSVDGDPGRGGVAAADDAVLAEQILSCQGLRLRGVMAVAPLDWDPREAFDTVARRCEALRSIAPEATVVSAGMSADFAAAIESGASMIRLGDKLLGPRGDVGYPVGK